jgi:hypothetical protein
MSIELAPLPMPEVTKLGETPQWKHAKRPDSSGVAMTIHMSKHLLGQNDKALHLNLTVEQVDEIIARLERERARVNAGEQLRDRSAHEVTR